MSKTPDETGQSDERKILALCCENSALLAAGAAEEDGLAELVQIVPLPCSGKAEVGLVLRLLERRHPGVLILGCPRDNCKFLKGNLRAEKRALSIRRILRETGYGEERVRMDFLSSVDSHRFVEITRRMSEDLAGLRVPPDPGRGAAEGGSP
jgi:coenzyme F420-reducing hydrogenase delta subunit